MGHLMPVQKCLVIFFIFEVSAHPLSNHQNYLQHDFERKLKTGSGSSLAEIDFHPLGDVVATGRDESSRISLQHNNNQHHSRSHPHNNRQQHMQQHLQRYQPLNDEFIVSSPLSDGMLPAGQQGATGIKYFHYPLEGRVVQFPLTFDPINRYNENYVKIDDVDKQDTATDDFNDTPTGNDEATNGHYGNFEQLFQGSSDAGQQTQSDRDLLNLQDDSLLTDDGQKRSAYRAIKREKIRKQSQFIPSISVGAMSNLGTFFDNLKNNIDVLERKGLSPEQMQILEGDHPVTSLRQELSQESLSSRPTGTAAFLHAVRTYRPSQRVRALVSMTPEGYHGSNFLDPNYMWVGLGK